MARYWRLQGETSDTFSKATGRWFPKQKISQTQSQNVEMGVEPKIWENPQIIHLFIGSSIIFTIHFGVPLFLETPKYHRYDTNTHQQAVQFNASLQDFVGYKKL